MSRNYKWISAGEEIGVDAPLGITGAVTHDSTLTQTGAATFAAKVTSAQLPTTAPAAIAANGTLSTSGVYIFNGADGAVHMPPVATNDGVTYVVANINGTGTATITDDATDSAPLIVDGATGASFLLTPNEVVHLVGYAAGTCWVGIS